MTINKKQIAYNRSKRTGPIRYIVIHDTGNTSKGANANAHFNYFNSGDRQSSADFFVDNTQVLQVNDYNTNYTWHCGDGAGKYGITNANSIGIEICINSDGNYDAAFQNAVALAKQLMSELNIPIERVVRHYDASRKNCPASMSNNNWLLWNTFKAQLKGESSIPWYNDAQWWVKANNISDGTRPDDTCTRAEVWQMLYRVAQKI
ncbi:MAG: N-acetylmuramoyl-L-alanine amidase [Candidatus Dojkabacteria bacterium]